MKSAFHNGELAVQEKAGVASMASRIGGSIKSAIHPVAQNFLRYSPFVIAASTDKDGDVWASALYGGSGFIEVPDAESVRIIAKGAGGLLRQNIADTGRIGLLAIEFDTRMRMRLNGKAVVSEGYIEVQADEVFSNCQKYIQSREERGGTYVPVCEGGSESSALSASQRTMIEAADTFFIATYHPEHGTDASHRGGNPGFVKVLDDRTMVFPDYSGNNMFQTLGNIEDNGKAGLLFIDFTTGDTLQMTGRAEILWDQAEFRDLEGAQRAVRFYIEKVLERKGAFPAGWRFIDYSPSNP